MRQTLPFRLQGIDSDNGSEFINAHLVRYCQRHGIQFTRGRPYKKDDNAHIEQKNWTHVRQLLGYVRYDSPAAVAAMNALYRHELRLFQNLFLPSVKLVRKVRVGARLRRVYDRPARPSSASRPAPRPIPAGRAPGAPGAARPLRPRRGHRPEDRAAGGAGHAGAAADGPAPTAASLPAHRGGPAAPASWPPTRCPGLHVRQPPTPAPSSPVEGDMLDGLTIHPSVSFLDGLTGASRGNTSPGSCWPVAPSTAVSARRS